MWTVKLSLSPLLCGLKVFFPNWCCQLFALAIEPLVASLRQIEAIEGITQGDTTHKLSLYADDLLLSDLAFRAWHGNGIRLVKDLYVNKVFASFEQLSKKYTLPPFPFILHLQIRHFVQRGFHPFPERPPGTTLDSLLGFWSQGSHILDLRGN